MIFLAALPAIACQNSSPSNSPVASRMKVTCLVGPVLRLWIAPAVIPVARRTAVSGPALGPAATTRCASASEK